MSKISGYWKNSLFIMNLNCFLFNICKVWMWFICVSCVFWRKSCIFWKEPRVKNSLFLALLHICFTFIIKNTYMFVFEMSCFLIKKNSVTEAKKMAVIQFISLAAVWIIIVLLGKTHYSLSKYFGLFWTATTVVKSVTHFGIRWCFLWCPNSTFTNKGDTPGGHRLP